MANKEDNKELNQLANKKISANELDTSGKSLSEALEISFVILKVIMVILVIAFLASGFKTIGPDENALVLRFGKIRGTGEKRVLGPGPHWILPYPIDKIVKIPVGGKNNLNIDSFWYYLTDQEKALKNPRPVNPDDPLNPLQDGYCLTRSASQNQEIINAEGNDYNIVHTKWVLTYQIINPERFFTNVKILEDEPVDIFDDVIKRSMEPLLQSMFEDVVVTTMVNYTIEEAITSRDRIPTAVKTKLQDKLDTIESGIKVVSVQLTYSEVPRQVKPEYEASTLASQYKQKVINEAETQADKLLTETAGPFARQLYDSLHDEDMSEGEKELLWSKLSGKAKGILESAQTNAKGVVIDAEASARYFQSLLPEYRKRPEVVITRLYYDAMTVIMANAEEKFLIQNTENIEDSEIRINLNRDPSLAAKRKKENQNKDQTED